MELFENKNPKFEGWLRVVIFIIPFIFTIFFTDIISYFFANFIFETKSESIKLLIIKFNDFIFVNILLFIFRKYIDKNSIKSMGFELQNRFKDIIIGTLIGFFVMFFSYYLLLNLGEITLLKSTFNLSEIITAILIYLFVAYVEEIVFRGYILNNFMLSCNKFWALFWSSLLFGLLHCFNPNMDIFSFLSIILAGYFLGITYIFTRNLWFPIALHFSWNFFQSMVGFNVSGQDFYSCINFNIVSPNKLNGGSFGLEGSYISTAVEFVVIGLVFWYYTIFKKKN
jgi:membrane protease YdiL (CAAX protease family)